jgi:hypothetical protein
VLLTYVLTSLLANHGWWRGGPDAATSATSVVALTSSHARRAWCGFAIWLSGLTICSPSSRATTAHLAQLRLGDPDQPAGARDGRGPASGGHPAEVGSRTILGAISVYTVLGILFTFLYGRSSGSRRRRSSKACPPAGSDFLFFSYTTLTTTGYGNLVPGGQPGGCSPAWR